MAQNWWEDKRYIARGWTVAKTPFGTEVKDEYGLDAKPDTFAEYEKIQRELKPDATNEDVTQWAQTWENYQRERQRFAAYEQGLVQARRERPLESAFQVSPAELAQYVDATIPGPPGDPMATIGELALLTQAQWWQ